MPVHKFDGLRQMTFENQNVIGKVELFQQRNATIEIFTQHVEIIRLVMQYMAHRFEFIVRTQLHVPVRGPASDQPAAPSQRHRE